MLTPQISALIQQMFRGRERGTAFGLFGTIVGISTAVGPLLGGLIIQAAGHSEGWRWVFYVNLPIGIATIPIAWRLLPAPEPSRGKHEHDLDPVGVLLLGAGVVSLLLPFVQEQQRHGSGKWLLVLLSAALIAGFVSWERHYAHRGREPVIDLGLFRMSSYTYGISLITLYFAGFTPLFFVFTLLLQNGLGCSALAAGLAITPFALGSAVSAALGGRVVHRFCLMLIVIGLVMVAIGLAGRILAVREVPEHGTGWATLAPLAFGGFGSGLVIAPNQTITLSEVPVAQAGTAGGLLQTGQRIGSAVGIAAAGSVFFARLSATHGQGWDSAFQRGIAVAVGFVIAALVVALIDVVMSRRVATRETATAEARQ